MEETKPTPQHTQGLLTLSPRSDTHSFDGDEYAVVSLLSDLGGVVADIDITTQFKEPIARANADRLRDCWNALAGINDPAAFVARLAAAEQRVKTLAEAGSGVVSMIDGLQPSFANGNEHNGQDEGEVLASQAVDRLRAALSAATQDQADTEGEV